MRQQRAIRVFVSLPGVLLISAAIPVFAAKPGGNVPKAAKRLPSVALQSEFAKAKKWSLPFAQPNELSTDPASGCYELVVTTNKFTSPDAGEVDPAIPKTFERLCYNGLPVGPTIRLHREQAFSICLRNKLAGAADMPSDPVPGVPEGEKPHGFSSTNLHTHGLHISPDGKADNVFQCVNPGCNFTFVYDGLAKKHPSGTFWYHPHKHGSVAYQLSNGLSGALIVEGDPKNPKDLESIPEIAAASTYGRQNAAENHERIVVLQLFTYRIGCDGIGRIDASQIYNVTPDALSSQSIPVTGPAPPQSAQPVQVTAINGVINPTFTIAPGEVQRWRIIHAGWDLLRQLAWVDDSDNSTDEIEFQEIAIDGLATGTMIPQNPLQIAPGQRSDALLSAKKSLKPGTIYHLKQLPVSGALATNNQGTDANYLARLVVQGPEQDMHLPDLSNSDTVKKLADCRPFASIQASELVKCPDKIATLNGTTPGTLNMLASDAIQTYTLNGQTFHQLSQQPVEIPVGKNKAQEWTIASMVSSHPFHIHVNPFQVVSYTDPSGNVVAMDQWRDTLYVPQGASYTIRSRFEDFVGDSVLHCHILDHEDQGMMMCLRFTGPANGKQPVGPGCSTLQIQTCNVPAPKLQLPDALGRQHEPLALPATNSALVFFRGMGCPHCTEQLRRLVADARKAGNLNAGIVAISSEAVEDEAKALTELGVTDGDRFQLLVDKDHRAFRDFGCYRGSDPKHGLFLIDEHGVVRARYSGEMPYADVSDIVRRLQLLHAAAGNVSLD